MVVVGPYINKLTKSELHAIMTGGFATVAGSYMAVLIDIGVSHPRCFKEINLCVYFATRSLL